MVREFGQPTVELHPMKIKLSRAGLGTTAVIEISMSCTVRTAERSCVPKGFEESEGIDGKVDGMRWDGMGRRMDG